MKAPACLVMITEDCAPVAVPIGVAVAGALEASRKLRHAVRIPAPGAGRPPEAVSISIPVARPQIAISIVVSHVACAVEKVAVPDPVGNPQVAVAIVVANVRDILAVEVAVADSVYQAHVVVAIAVAGVGSVRVVVAVRDSIVQAGVAVAIGIAGALRRSAAASVHGSPRETGRTRDSLKCRSCGGMLNRRGEVLRVEGAHNVANAVQVALVVRASICRDRECSESVAFVATIAMSTLQIFRLLQRNEVVVVCAGFSLPL